MANALLHLNISAFLSKNTTRYRVKGTYFEDTNLRWIFLALDQFRIRGGYSTLDILTGGKCNENVMQFWSKMLEWQKKWTFSRVTSILRFIPPPHYNISGGGEIPPKYSAKIPLPPSLTPAFATAPQETLISSQLHFTPSSQFSLQKLQCKTGGAVLSPHFRVVLVFFNGCWSLPEL